MPYSRPSQYPDFCLTGTRSAPPNGEINSGYQPDQIPPCEEHNYLFGLSGDWVRWLDQITNNAALFPVSNAGHNVATSTNLQGQLDQLDAVMSSLGIIVIPKVIANGTATNFPLSQAPINSNSVVPALDGVECSGDQYTIQNISGVWTIVFNSAPVANQEVGGFFLTGSSGVGVGGGIGAIENAPGGIGVYFDNDVNVAVMKSLIAGTNVDIVDNGDGTLTLSATGGGGGGGVETHGSASSPVSIDPAVGVAPTTAADQVWWIKPISGTGAVPITASPAISAGTSLGQKLKLKSLASANYLTIPNGSGTDQNGPISMGTYAQTIEYTWDGINWSEDSRRV